MSLQTISLQMHDLQYVINDDIELHQQPIMEVWHDEQLVAELRQVDGEWIVTLFTKFQEYQLSLKQFTIMQKQFLRFVKQQT